VQQPEQWIREVKNQRLQVRITFEGSRHHLGLFRSLYEARKAIIAFWRSDKDTLGKTKYVKTFHTAKGTVYQARVVYGGETHDLGRFQTYKEASDAVIKFVRGRWPEDFEKVMKRR
jgi:hypothetical protein